MFRGSYASEEKTSKKVLIPGCDAAKSRIFAVPEKVE